MRHELSYLCFVRDHIRFERQFLSLTPTVAFFKPLYEPDPAFDLIGIQIRDGRQSFTAIERFFSLIHPLDEDEKITKCNLKSRCGTWFLFDNQFFHNNSL